MLQKQSACTLTSDRIIFPVYLPVPDCVGLPKKGFENMVLVGLLQTGAKNFTLYHGLAIYTEVTFVNVHHAQMSTFVIEVCLWYIGFVLVFI